MHASYSRTERASSDHLGKLKELMLKNGNRSCADCSAQEPQRASVNIGVFICLKCADIHRSFGEDFSKVLSVIVEEWSEDDVNSMMMIGGNSSANSIYEAYIPKGYSKIKPNASEEERSNFIRSKYKSQEFLKPILRMLTEASIKHSRSGKSPEKSPTKSPDCNSRRSNKSIEVIGESIGDLKVVVVRGTNLAIRDVFSSDPYIVLTIGKQKARTTVIKSNLNPVWNEEFTLAVPESHRTLKLQVFDQDVFSSDDVMGGADVDLKPMITSASTFRDPVLLGNMQIGKWIKAYDNALIKDSIVEISEGKIRQDVLLKLQNVESGEVELQLEWIPRAA